VIGYEGETAGDRPHLHFEMRLDNVAFDPLFAGGSARHRAVSSVVGF